MEAVWLPNEAHRNAAAIKGEPAMSLGLWSCQALLAFVFAVTGLPKIARPIPSLAPRMPFTQILPLGVLHFIGLAEMLEAIGVILPSFTGILPWLKPVAAAGLLLLMTLAAGFNLKHREYPKIAVNVLLCVIAAFVAYGRRLNSDESNKSGPSRSFRGSRRLLSAWQLVHRLPGLADLGLSEPCPNPRSECSGHGRRRSGGDKRRDAANGRS
jgi:putative oxidoreductase